MTERGTEPGLCFFSVIVIILWPFNIFLGLVPSCLGTIRGSQLSSKYVSIDPPYILREELFAFGLTSRLAVFKMFVAQNTWEYVDGPKLAVILLFWLFACFYTHLLGRWFEADQVPTLHFNTTNHIVSSLNPVVKGFGRDRKKDVTQPLFLKCRLSMYTSTCYNPKPNHVLIHTPYGRHLIPLRVNSSHSSEPRRVKF